MVAVIIALRDFILAAALAWIGVTFEAKPQHAPAPAPSLEQSCVSGACEARRPSYNTGACTQL